MYQTISPGPQRDWPEAGLEMLGKCPVCENAQRSVVHEGLQDKVFFCAPGVWTLWRCATCGSAYLDPRPDRTTIHEAYASYYTHGRGEEGKASYASLSLPRKLRRRLVNGYTNWRYSTEERPASGLGKLLHLVAPIRLLLAHEYRHLPRDVPCNGRVLDVGCGSGNFLATAKSCGWSAVGLDPDPKAVDNARTRGVEVLHGDLGVFAGQSELFDVVTICHVIEHVHDPAGTLADLYRLLKPGGQLWLETPNIEASGHSYFREHWQGLDAPRHLAILSPSSLEMALERAGFKAIRYRSTPSPLRGMFDSSEAIRHGLPFGAPVSQSLHAKIWFSVLRLVQIGLPRRREFLLVTAKKPK